MTPLDGPLKRALRIGGEDYTLLIEPQGFKLSEKGKRRGLQLRWADLLSGEAAFAAALQASLHAGLRPSRSRKVAPARAVAAEPAKKARARSRRRSRRRH